VSWLRLSLLIECADLAAAEEMLTRAGAQGLSVSDAGHSPLLEPAPGTTPLWDELAVSALFPASVDLAPVLALLRARFGDGAQPAVEALDEAAWRLQPHDVRPAVTVGERLAIAAAQADAQSQRKLLKLNFGLAFGTGTHPTTALCLEWLEHEVGPGARVLDYGCGSGILALAALVLGASAAWAVDIEPQALSATHDNARLNDVAARLWIGPPSALPHVVVDIAVANILARPLLGLVDTFARCLTPGGALVLCGLLHEQCDAVERAYGRFFGGFERSYRDDWARLTARRRVADAV
jgi:ribosomal protein L11 methyltransferase